MDSIDRINSSTQDSPMAKLGIASEVTQVRVAVTQAEPKWLDLQGSIDKTCALISEAARGGAQLLAFPECWVTGYPAWIWARPGDTHLTSRYIKNCMRTDGPEMAKIQQCAADNDITAIIDSDGKLLALRRKIKATHMERTIFGDASGDALTSVVDTKVGRVGALSCWEHIQPLLKYYLYSHREQIHVAAWPPLHPYKDEKELWSMSREGARALSQTYAIESQAFVLHATAVISEHGISLMNTEGGDVMNTPGGGSSAIFGPDGRILTEDLPQSEEGILLLSKFHRMNNIKELDHAMPQGTNELWPGYSHREDSG
ncbi:aliphatic nitrilase [Fusarium subglutinans]|uniref:nitrilase n=1 Tax=Gibberella subglutinans TaxID=42677 RepID=A0A8H5PYR1_GIBSU|nr:aliphatic nitrilase [Fusarium subglutinans]KAF5604553.1 aliphatic nitrilase [Fusarium subglutinans]